MPGSRVRLAGHDDGPTIAALRRAWSQEQAGRPILDESFEGRFDAWLERERDQRLTWLGLAGGSGPASGEAVGMLNLLVFTRMPFPRDDGYDRPRSWGYLANFFVLEEHRASGLGSLMLEACLAYADSQGLARVVLSPSSRSVPLYARAGFAPATSLMLRPLPPAES